MKNLITILLRTLALMLVVSPAACSGDPAPTPGKTSPALPTEAITLSTGTPEPVATSPPAQAIPLTAQDIAGTEIDFWHVWEDERGGLIEVLAAEFSAENPYGLQVIPVQQRDLHNAVIRAAAAGGLPDLAVGFSYHVRAWGERTALVDLAPYLADAAWGLPAADREDFISEFWAPAADNGEQYGLPFFRTAEILLYNRSWAGELGFSGDPLTPEALAEQLCAANAAMRTDADTTNDGDGGLLLGYDPLALAAWMAAFGGSVEPGDGAYGFERAENAAAFSYLRGLLDDGCAWTPEAAYPHAEFAGRRGLVMASTLAGLAPHDEAMAAAGSSDEWAVLPYPSHDGAGSVLFSGPDLVLFSGPEAEELAAWVFAAWLTSPDVQVRWAEATGYYPARLSALQTVGGAVPGGEAWIELARPFHPPGSWAAVQWVVSDFARVLYAPLTTAAEVSALSAELDLQAEEIHASGRSP